jgi:hypothetical protein
VCEDAARHLGVAVPEVVGRLTRPRARFVEWFRARRAEGAGDAPRMRLAALLYSAALCDGVALSVASLGRNTTRIARRRLSRRVSHEPGGAA